jgi:hypothetical protein
LIVGIHDITTIFKTEDVQKSETTNYHNQGQGPQEGAQPAPPPDPQKAKLLIVIINNKAPMKGLDQYHPQTQKK